VWLICSARRQKRYNPQDEPAGPGWSRPSTAAGSWPASGQPDGQQA